MEKGESVNMLAVQSKCIWHTGRAFAAAIVVLVFFVIADWSDYAWPSLGRSNTVPRPIQQHKLSEGYTMTSSAAGEETAHGQRVLADGEGPTTHESLVNIHIGVVRQPTVDLKHTLLDDEFVSDGADESVRLGEDTSRRHKLGQRTRKAFGTRINASSSSSSSSEAAPRREVRRRAADQLPLVDILMSDEDREYRHKFGVLGTYSKDLSRQAIEAGNVHPAPLLNGYQNPCWLEELPGDFNDQTAFYKDFDCQGQNNTIKSFNWTHAVYSRRSSRGEHWRIRCFPYFMVLGVTKSGTTDLYFAMTRHLKHVLSGARKEPQFWNRRIAGIPYGRCQQFSGLKATFDDYLSLYDEAAEKIRLRKTNNSTFAHPIITGDFTPATLWMLPNTRHLAAGDINTSDHSTAQHIHAINPRTKFLVILRDPVQRAFSHYKFFNYNQSPIDLIGNFHRVAVQQMALLTACFKQNSFRNCVYNFTNPLDIEQNVVVPGIYYVFLKDWLKIFPKSQFHILRFEDYIRDRGSALQKVARFLQTDPPSQEDMSVLRRGVVHNLGQSSSNMLSYTRKLLQIFYQRWNTKLSVLLADSRFKWASEWD